MWREDAHRDQKAKRNRKVVMAAFLWQIRRGEIDGDALCRKAKADGLQGGTNPLPAFSHGLVAKPDNSEADDPSSHMNLNIHRPRLDALKRDRLDMRDHFSPSPDYGKHPGNAGLRQE